MKKIIQKINNFVHFREFFAYKLFISFGLLIIAVLGVALALPKFDVREVSLLKGEELITLRKESYGSARQYHLDDIFEESLSVSTVSGLNIILLDPDTSLFVGIEPEQQQYFQTFLYKADDPTQPVKRVFNHLQFYGPFLVKTKTREYYEYFYEEISPQHEVLNTIFDSPWMMLIVLLLGSIPILIWLSLRISRPMNELQFSANAVAKGDLMINPKLETESIREFREVGRSFNHMVRALQDLTKHQQRMLSDISHELKTPLARLQLSTALIRRKLGELPELTRIENQIIKLDAMVHDLLELSRQQIKQNNIRENFAITQIWDGMLEDTKFEIEASGLTFSVNIQIKHPENIFLNGNVQLLTSAVENIIRNAKKYADKMIKVRLAIEEQQLIIRVDDDGIGVPESEYDEIFRPFYRVGDDRARQTGGTGLGLAIVHNAVQQHRGTVKAMKSDLGGLRVEIKLPLS